MIGFKQTITTTCLIYYIIAIGGLKWTCTTDA